MGNGSKPFGHFTRYRLPLTGYGAAAALAALLAGCGSAPTRDAPAESQPPTAKAPAPRGGGYYLDDGPGANPPADLDGIPDAVPRPEPIRTATSRPYTVMGRSYTPMTSLQAYRARGIATWYGRRYHGKPSPAKPEVAPPATVVMNFVAASTLRMRWRGGSE
jgi:rare lipoprotein A (peptidoglycan hydrolase)